MKKLLTTLSVALLSMAAFSQSFVSPIGFVATDESKADVLAYIRKQVKQEYAKIGMDDPSTLRMMEKKNLDAFKELTKATNTELLRKVTKTYCDLGMCDYDTILMMYNKENKESQKTTEW